MHQAFIAVSLYQMFFKNFRRDVFPFFKHKQRFNQISQLSDISRPGVANQHFAGFGAEPFKNNFMLALKLMNKVFGKQQNIFTSFPQRGNLKLNTPKAVKEVFPEVFFSDSLIHIFVRSCNNACVGVDGFR